MSERDILREGLEISDAAGRAAYLDRACGGDAALRGRVEGLPRSRRAASSLPGLATGSVSVPEQGITASRHEGGDIPTLMQGKRLDADLDDALAFLMPAR